MRSTAYTVLAGALLTTLLACVRPDVTLPEQVCGRWITDDARYKGRYIELSNEMIRFGNGGEEIEACPVVAIQKSGAGADFRYDITYLDVSGNESVFSFDHLVPHGTIRFVNSPQRRWTKAPG